jgi:hypothetical protein
MAYRHISFLYTLAKLNAFFLGQSENVSAERTSNSITKQVNSHLRHLIKQIVVFCAIYNLFLLRLRYTSRPGGTGIIKMAMYEFPD